MVGDVTRPGSLIVHADGTVAGCTEAVTSARDVRTTNVRVVAVGTNGMTAHRSVVSSGSRTAATTAARMRLELLAISRQSGHSERP